MKLVLLGKNREIDGVYTFRFKAPADLQWTAGQSIRLELKAGYGVKERRFSISAAPFEKEIRVTTRVSESDFKQALDALAPGDEIDGFGIEGSFVWEDTPQPKVLCAQGIGITAFRPMLKQLDYEGKQINAMLLYASRTDSFLFAKDLEELLLRHPEFRVILLPNQRLEVETILSHAPHLEQSTVYLSGASKMVDEISPQLLKAGLPGHSLKQDWFTGQRGWDEFENVAG